MKNSLIILGFFVAGIACGYFMQHTAAAGPAETLTRFALYALVFLVGLTIGGNAAGIIRGALRSQSSFLIDNVVTLIDKKIPINLVMLRFFVLNTFDGDPIETVDCRPGTRQQDRGVGGDDELRMTGAPHFI